MPGPPVPNWSDPLGRALPIGAPRPPPQEQQQDATAAAASPSAWRVAVSPATDAEGWVYGTAFAHLQYDRPGGRASKRSSDRVRSRLWQPASRGEQRRGPEPPLSAATVGAAVDAVVSGGGGASGTAATASDTTTNDASLSAAPASLAALWGMASKLVADAAARHRGAHNVITLDPSGWLFVLGDHAALMRRLQLAQLRRLVWFSDDGQLLSAMRPATSAEAEAAGVLQGGASRVALPGAPTLSVVLELGRGQGAGGAAAPSPSPSPSPSSTAGHLQLRVCPRAHLEELVAAARYSLAAYAYVASAGHLSSAGAALRLVASLPAFDAVDGVSEQANLRALLSIARLPHARDVLHAEWRAAPFRPAHYVAVDRRRRCVVLCVRGSLGLGDAMTDLAAAPRPFEFRGVRGHVHEGLMAAAAYVQSRCADALARAAAIVEREERVGEEVGEGKGTTKTRWPLLVCGHSMGGAVACVLTMLLQQQDCQQQQPLPLFSHVRCVCVGPAAVLSARLSDCVRPHVTSVVLGTDPVPRLSQYSVERLLLDLVAGSLSRRALVQASLAAASAQGAVVALAARLQKLAGGVGVGGGGGAVVDDDAAMESAPPFGGTGGLRDFLEEGEVEEEGEQATPGAAAGTPAAAAAAAAAGRAMEEDEFLKLLDWGGLRSTFVRSWFGDGSQGGGGVAAAGGPTPLQHQPQPPPPATTTTTTVTTPRTVLAKPGRAALAPTSDETAVLPSRALLAPPPPVATTTITTAAPFSMSSLSPLQLCGGGAGAGGGGNEADVARAAIEGLGSPSRCPPPLAPLDVASAAAPPPGSPAAAAAVAAAALLSPRRGVGADAADAAATPRSAAAADNNDDSAKEEMVHSLEEDLAHVVHLYPPGRVLWLLSDDLVGGAAQQLARAVEAHLLPAGAAAAGGGGRPSDVSSPATLPPAVLQPPQVDEGMRQEMDRGSRPVAAADTAAAANSLRAGAAEAARGVLADDAGAVPPAAREAAREVVRGEEARRPVAGSGGTGEGAAAGERDGKEQQQQDDDGDDHDEDLALLPPHVRELLDLLGPPVDAPSAMAIAHKRALLLDHVRRTRQAHAPSAASASSSAERFAFGMPRQAPPEAAAAGAAAASPAQESALARLVRERLEALRDGLAAALPPADAAAAATAAAAACVLPPHLAAGGGGGGGSGGGRNAAAVATAAPPVIVEPARDAFDRLVLHRSALDDHVPDAYLAALRRLAAAHGIVEEE
jgi:hypothetical protein